MQNVECNAIGVHQNSQENAELSIPLQFQDVCPLCGIGVNMAQSLVYTYHDAQDKSLCFHVFCLHLCPTCHKLFVTRHEIYSTPLYGFYDKEQISFPPAPLTNAVSTLIKSSYPLFSDIYAEALAAKYCGLYHIYGMSLRKAVECLIKDYAVFKHPDDYETIAKKDLCACIDLYLQNNDLKTLAHACRILGNNETHWINKNTDEDLQALEGFIPALIAFIEFEIKALAAGAYYATPNTENN